MPTATADASLRTPAVNFALSAVAWSLGLFGLVRLGWFEAQVVLPVTQLQGRISASGFGAPALPIQITLECSGADALALCAGAILAYPVRWRTRLSGAATGIALILALNIIRIGTLGRAAASPWFGVLHVYLWPGLLALATAAYVFTWMRFADRTPGARAPHLTPDAPALYSARPSSRLTRRFAILTTAFLVLFIAGAPLYLESARILPVAAFIAHAAAETLRTLGIPASAAGNMLATTRGAFLVTQECIATPLIPVYLAAVCSYARSWRWAALALLATIPLFIALGIARLLIVAVPAALIGSPLLLIHAFYQLLLAALIIVLAAFYQHGPGTAAWTRALLGAAVGGTAAYLIGPVYTDVLTSAFAAGARHDPQGAIALLPSFQIGLYVAVAVTVFAMLKWRRFATGFALLMVSQVGVLAALHVLAVRTDFVPHVRDVRAWALAAPLLLLLGLVNYGRSRR